MITKAAHSVFVNHLTNELLFCSAMSKEDNSSSSGHNILHRNIPMRKSKQHKLSKQYLMLISEIFSLFVVHQVLARLKIQRVMFHLAFICSRHIPSKCTVAAGCAIALRRCQLRSSSAPFRAAPRVTCVEMFSARPSAAPSPVQGRQTRSRDHHCSYQHLISSV